MKNFYRALSPVCAPSGKRVKPGKCSAVLNRNGALAIGKPENPREVAWRYILKQFENDGTSGTLVDLWKARMAAIKAQGKYEVSWQKIQTITS
jgi:hypothetical protein